MLILDVYNRNAKNKFLQNLTPCRIRCNVDCLIFLKAEGMIMSLTAKASNSSPDYKPLYFLHRYSQFYIHSFPEFISQEVFRSWLQLFLCNLNQSRIISYFGNLQNISCCAELQIRGFSDKLCLIAANFLGYRIYRVKFRNNILFGETRPMDLKCLNVWRSLSILKLHEMVVVRRMKYF